MWNWNDRGRLVLCKLWKEVVTFGNVGRGGEMRQRPPPSARLTKRSGVEDWQQGAQRFEKASEKCNNHEVKWDQKCAKGAKMKRARVESCSEVEEESDAWKSGMKMCKGLREAENGYELTPFAGMWRKACLGSWAFGKIHLSKIPKHSLLKS